MRKLNKERMEELRRDEEYDEEEWMRARISGLGGRGKSKWIRRRWDKKTKP